MPSPIYETDRLEKISQIMPQFSKVAAVGDSVLMGLEGDPAFPSKYNTSRPVAKITDVREANPEEVEVTLSFEDGTERKVNSSTISPYDVWEFDDDTFQKVMKREQTKAEDQARAEAQINEKFRGTSDADALRKEVGELKALVEQEREHARSFNNTLIASMREMANDICKLDKKNNGAEFCRVFRNEYGKMLARAEGPVEESSAKKEYRGSKRGTSSSTSLTSDKGRPMDNKMRGTQKEEQRRATMFSDSEESVTDSDSDVNIN